MQTSQQTNSAIRALAIAQDIATRTLSAAVIYNDANLYTIEQCSMSFAKRAQALCGNGIGDAGVVSGVVYH